MKRSLYLIGRILFGVVALLATLIGVLDLVRVRDFNLRKPSTKLILPEGRPEVGQASIDFAMVVFDIQTFNCRYPKFNRSLSVRGLMRTEDYFGSREQIVDIGPAAFQSWGLLGSTLAHEFEVHCRQNLFLINLKEIAGLGGVSEAEFEAYQYEIEQAHRFHLSQSEIDMIYEIQKDFIK